MKSPNANGFPNLQKREIAGVFGLNVFFELSRKIGRRRQFYSRNEGDNSIHDFVNRIARVLHMGR